MIETVEFCLGKIKAYQDTPELLEWIASAKEDAEAGSEMRYWLGELWVQLDGMYGLMHSMAHHLKQPDGAREIPIENGELKGPNFVRVGTVLEMTGMSRATLYRTMKERKFPNSIRLKDSPGMWWRVSDVKLWQDTSKERVD